MNPKALVVFWKNGEATVSISSAEEVENEIKSISEEEGVLQVIGLDVTDQEAMLCTMLLVLLDSLDSVRQKVMNVSRIDLLYRQLENNGPVTFYDVFFSFVPTLVARATQQRHGIS